MPDNSFFGRVRDFVAKEGEIYPPLDARLGTSVSLGIES
jgi:hypothetical protein